MAGSALDRPDKPALSQRLDVDQRGVIPGAQSSKRNLMQVKAEGGWRAHLGHLLP
jgi:hypothetical protein